MTSFAILLALIAFSPTQIMAKGPGGGHGGGGGGHGGGEARGGGEGHGGGEAHGGGGGGNRSGGFRIEQGGGHQGGVGGNARLNPGVRSNLGGVGGPAVTRHQAYDAHNRPEFSGGRGEGRDGWRYRWDNDRWWFYGPDNRWMWYGDDGRWLNYGNAYVVQRPILQNFSGGPIRIVNPAENGVTLNYTLDGTAFTIPPGYSQEIRDDRAWVIEFSRGANSNPTRYGLQSGVYTFTLTNQGVELYRSDFRQR